MSKTIVQVSALVKKISGFLSSHVHLNNLQIAGEISNIRNVRGHLYFDLKDDQGQMSCVMWASHARRLSFRPENGMSVLVDAELGVYEQRGSLQLLVSNIELAGEGRLYAILEERKRRLAEAGYFLDSHKKSKPPVIGRIAIVTGNDTAALKDVEKTIASRWPMLERTLFPALVQGEKAPAEIIRQLRRADAMGFDAILLVRGGGSMEDLFCFNDEELVKTIYDLNTYVITGIGHEIDYTLADFVADHRAVTPTAAAQWATLDQHQIQDMLASQKQSIASAAKRIFNQNAQTLLNLQNSVWLSQPQLWVQSRRQAWQNLDQALKGALPGFLDGASIRLQSLESQLTSEMKNLKASHTAQLSRIYNTLMYYNPATRLQTMNRDLDYMQRELISALHTRMDMAGQNYSHLTQNLMTLNPKARIQNAWNQLNSLEQLLYANSPMAILEKGYAIVWQNGHQIHSAASAVPGEMIAIQMSDGSLEASLKKASLSSSKAAE